MEIYLVGGAVRDMLLEKTVHDRDYVVLGATEEAFLERFPKAKKVGARKSVYIDGGDEYTLSTASDITEDLKKRDLTINAFANDSNGKLFAHPDAHSDLENKILRPISAQNFLNDPLRAFRAARFAAAFSDFKVHDSLTNVMRMTSCKAKLGSIAAERVGNELIKACGSGNPGCFFQMLADTEILKPWFKELVIARNIPAGPLEYHSGSVFDHLIDVMNKLAGNEIRVWMGLCHDLGKILTDSSLLPKHHNHDIAGEKLAKDLGFRLKLPLKFIRAGSAAARWHMVAGKYDQLRSGTKVNLLVSLKKYQIIENMFELVNADKGLDFSEQAKNDTEIISGVHLPEKYYGMGKKSGEILHGLRCSALKNNISIK